MKHIKKLTIIVLLLALMMFLLPAKAVSKVQLEINGQKITYDNGEKVMINAEYERKSTEFRAVWVSPATNDIAGYTSMQQYKEQIYDVLDKMDYYNLNVMIFHVRIMNDAIYKSKYNKWSVYYNENPDWDALPWIIEECHKRGIEFHAWMNPYRVTNNVALSLEELAKRFDRGNPASNPKNMLRGSASTILNPGLPEVQSFLVDTCMELIENYDVDAIHFDDYFYPTTEESFDSDYYKSYKSTGGRLSLAAWRRQNVNELISRVYSAIKNINPDCVFGVSPTGNTNSNYSALYCDVYTWVTSAGYVDYICPQLYYGFNHKSLPYLTVLDEFDGMITKSGVKLIIGLAAYKAGAEDTYAGSTGKLEWTQNSDILSREVTAARRAKNYGGFALYRYDSLYNPAKSVAEIVGKEKRNLLDIM